MYIIFYKNPSKDQSLESFTDFATFLDRNELQAFIDNFKYPADYRIFYATETFEYRKDL